MPRGRFHPHRWLTGAVAGSILVGAGWLWLTLVSPFGYSPPDGLASIDEDRPHRVFVYGTLRYPVVRMVLIGRDADPRPATLPDHRRQGLDIRPDPGGRTDGLVFEVTAEDLRRLDRYERLGIRYERIEHLLTDGEPAWVYRRLSKGD